MASYGGETPVDTFSSAINDNIFSYTVAAGKYAKGFIYIRSGAVTGNIEIGGVSAFPYASGDRLEVLFNSGDLITLSGNSGQAVGFARFLIFNNPS